MDLTELIGLLGVIGIAISWIPQTLKVIKDRAAHLELKFVLIYSSGSVLLLVYSVLIMDWVFIVLNSLTTIMAAINLYYALHS